MRTLLIAILLCCICPQSYSQYFPVDTARLNKTFAVLIAGPNTPENQKAFLDAFPSTFSEFMMVYQFVPDPQYNLAMYNKAHQHILEGMGKLSLIPDSTYCDKLINLSFGGRWDADAPNYLKMVLHNTMQARHNVMFKCLTGKIPGQQFSFWYFYFNSLYVKKDGIADYQQLRKLMNSTYPALVPEFDAAYLASYGKAFIRDDFPHIH